MSDLRELAAAASRSGSHQLARLARRARGQRHYEGWRGEFCAPGPRCTSSGRTLRSRRSSSTRRRCAAVLPAAHQGHGDRPRAQLRRLDDLDPRSESSTRRWASSSKRAARRSLARRMERDMDGANSGRSRWRPTARCAEERCGERTTQPARNSGSDWRTCLQLFPPATTDRARCLPRPSSSPGQLRSWDRRRAGARRCASFTRKPVPDPSPAATTSR